MERDVDENSNAASCLLSFPGVTNHLIFAQYIKSSVSLETTLFWQTELAHFLAGFQFLSLLNTEATDCESEQLRLQ
jgi:hypothetical protein